MEDKIYDFSNYLDKVLETFLQENREEMSINIITEMEDKIEFKSLYEYLGKAAGKELGKKVFKFSKDNKIYVEYRQVNQGGYNGKVIVYPVTFLEDYFKRKEEHQFNKQYFE
jgi:hypothetical protein